MSISRSVDMSIPRSVDIPICRYVDIPVCRYVDIPICRYIILTLSIYSRLKHSSIAKSSFLPSRPSTRLATNLPSLLPCKTREEKKHRKSCRFFLRPFFIAFLCCFSFGISSLASAMHGGLEMPSLPLVRYSICPFLLLRGIVSRRILASYRRLPNAAFSSFYSPRYSAEKILCIVPTASRRFFLLLYPIESGFFSCRRAFR